MENNPIDPVKYWSDRAPLKISPRLFRPCTREEEIHCHDDTGCIATIIDCQEHHHGCYDDCHEECKCRNYRE